VAGEVFGFKKQQLPRWLERLFQPKVGYTLLALLVAVNLFLQKKDYFDKPDYPRMVAKYLRPKLNADDQVYTSNYSQIIYHLLDRQSPIRYIHPSLFWEEKHILALEVDRGQEIDRLKANLPKYIIVQDSFLPSGVDQFLEGKYQKVRQFGDRIFVFELIQ
jgi:hypothetical protein